MNWKNWILLKPIVDLYHMFFTNDNGFSWRKIAASFAVGAAYMSFNKITDQKIILESGNIWLIFAGICIGLVCIPDILKAVSIIFNGKDSGSDQPK